MFPSFPTKFVNEDQICISKQSCIQMTFNLILVIFGNQSFNHKTANTQQESFFVESGIKETKRGMCKSNREEILLHF